MTCSAHMDGPGTVSVVLVLLFRLGVPSATGASTSSSRSPASRSFAIKDVEGSAPHSLIQLARVIP